MAGGVNVQSGATLQLQVNGGTTFNASGTLALAGTGYNGLGALDSITGSNNTNYWSGKILLDSASGGNTQIDSDSGTLILSPGGTPGSTYFIDATQAAPNKLYFEGAGKINVASAGDAIGTHVSEVYCGGGTLTLAGTNAFEDLYCNGLVVVESAGAVPAGCVLGLGSNGSLTCGTPGYGEPLGSLSLASIDVDFGATLDLGGYEATAGTVSIEDGTVADGWLSVSGQLVVESGTVSANLTGDIALVKTGPGAVVLSGDNDYTGGTTVESGTLQVASSDALGGGGLYLSGGTLDLDGFDTTVGSLNGDGGTITDNSTTSGTSTLTTNTSACAWYSGAICDGASARSRST